MHTLDNALVFHDDELLEVGKVDWESPIRSCLFGLKPEIDGGTEVSWIDELSDLLHRRAIFEERTPAPEIPVQYRAVSLNEPETQLAGANLVVELKRTLEKRRMYLASLRELAATKYRYTLIGPMQCSPPAGLCEMILKAENRLVFTSQFQTFPGSIARLLVKEVI